MSGGHLVTRWLHVRLSTAWFTWYRNVQEMQRLRQIGAKIVRRWNSALCSLQVLSGAVCCRGSVGSGALKPERYAAQLIDSSHSVVTQSILYITQVTCFDYFKTGKISAKSQFLVQTRSLSLEILTIHYGDALTVLTAGLFQLGALKKL